MNDPSSLPDWVPQELREFWAKLSPEQQREFADDAWRAETQMTVDQARLVTDGPFEESLQALLDAIRIQAVTAKTAFLAKEPAMDRESLEKRLAELRNAAYSPPAIIEERLAELEGVETFEFPELSDP